MTDTWFTADFHLGHQNIVRYCDRPFQTLAVMDAEIVDRLNSSVKESDILMSMENPRTWEKYVELPDDAGPCTGTQRGSSTISYQVEQVWSGA